MKYYFCCGFSVACGSYHTVIVTHDGKVYSCGSNDHGQLGHSKPCKKPGEYISCYNCTKTSCLVDFMEIPSDEINPLLQNNIFRCNSSVLS